jgi:transposase
MLWWLKTGQITQHQTLAKRLGRDGSTVTRWLQNYRQGGLSELLALKSAPGKSPHLSLEVIAGLQKRLEQPRLFQKLRRNRGVALWETYQLNLTYPTVYHWVHYRLKAKLKVPRPKSAKQELNADQRFKKTSPQPC